MPSSIRDRSEAEAGRATTDDIDVPFELRDGYEVHRAALANGFNVTLLPRQVMLVEAPDHPGELSAFVHGLPQSSTLAGVTYAQDRRTRRAILARAGFSVPRGATFSVGRSAGAARRFANKLGYPLVVKPAEGDNTIEVKRNIQDQRDLNKAIAYFREATESRSGYVKAAYALTELREPGWENGRATVPPGYRFLIEESVRGQYLRFVVLDGKALNVLLCPNGPSIDTHRVNADVTDRVHPGLKDLAAAATRTMAGVSLAAVDLVVSDLTKNADAVVVEFSERPWLAVQAATNHSLSREIGESILSHGTAQAPEKPARVTIGADVRIAGSVNPRAVCQAIRARAQDEGVHADLDATAGIGDISGTLAGSPGRVAWLLESLMAGRIGHDRPMMIELKQTSPGGRTR